MKRRNKALSTLLALALTLSLTACQSGAPASSAAPAPEASSAAPAPAGAYTAGTYTAAARGQNGDVKVEVTVSENEITSVKVIESQETSGIGDLPIEQIPALIVSSQGLGIDAVAGATVTSEAVLAAVTDCLTQAGADIAALRAIRPEAAATAADETLEADVVVIGAGGAGLAAAVTANQAGSKVIVVEKMPKVGGNTILSGGALNAVDDGSETAKANDDSVERHYTQTFEGGDKAGDPALVHVLTDNAWDGVEWLKSLGMEFQDGVFTVTGGMWPRAHKPVEPVGTGFFKTYTQYMDSHDDIDLLLNTTATELLTENGRVVGVVCTGATGNTVTIRAGNGVVLATGGFGMNVGLREKYNTQWKTLGESVKSTNHAGATGDGLVLAEAVGAQMVQLGNIQLLPLGDPETGSLSGNIELDVERRIFVNTNGDRFVDEGARRDVMTAALFEQPDNMMWIVLDSHCYPTGDEKNNFNESANELVAAGRAFKGETLEELAAQIGVPAANLIASVEEFNKHAADKSADAFGRTLYSDPIDKGPFYAAARVPTVHHTMGGVKINADAQVLDAGDNPIPGFYAAGEVTGGIHGTNRLGGNALTDTVVFGRIAGASASAGK